MDVSRFIERTTDHQARLYQKAVSDMFVGYVRNNRGAMQDARRQLESVTTETVGIAEIIGATSVLQEVAAVAGDVGLLRDDRQRMIRFASEPTQSILPRVTFVEALEDFVDRTPETIKRSADRTAQAISSLYSDRRVVAFAHSAEESVTKAARDFIASALREGIDEGEAGKRLAMTVNEIRDRSGPWTEGYARMAFRTNVNTAVTAGRFRQAQDDDIRAVTPAFKFSTARDTDVRKNHMAANGIILRTDSAEWRKIAPPLGYNCRCRISLVSAPQLSRMGRLDNGRVIESRVPHGAHADEKFRHGGRPDILMTELVR